MSVIRIHYTRLPDRLSVFTQHLVHRDESCLIMLNAATQLHAPVMAGDRVILEQGAPVVWFTFPGLWHDIGRFHLADGSFTGFYANILTPVQFQSETDLSTTDLCLDVWLDANGTLSLLDEDEFDDAVQRGWISQPDAARARREAESLMRRAVAGSWPPAVVADWPLQKALAVQPSRASNEP